MIRVYKDGKSDPVEMVSIRLEEYSLNMILNQGQYGKRGHVFGIVKMSELKTNGIV